MKYNIEGTHFLLKVIFSFYHFVFISSLPMFLIQTKEPCVQREASFGQRIMSCFSCCEDDGIHTAPESGNPFSAKNPAGNHVDYL